MIANMTYVKIPLAPPFCKVGNRMIQNIALPYLCDILLLQLV